MNDDLMFFFAYILPKGLHFHSFKNRGCGCDIYATVLTLKMLEEGYLMDSWKGFMIILISTVAYVEAFFWQRVNQFRFIKHHLV